MGTVCFSVAGPDGRLDRTIVLPGSRADIRDRSTTVAMHMLLRLPGLSLFVALDLPAGLDLPGTVPPEKRHITLVFLGDVSPRWAIYHYLGDTHAPPAAPLEVSGTVPAADAPPTRARPHPRLTLSRPTTAATTRSTRFRHRTDAQSARLRSCLPSDAAPMMLLSTTANFEEQD